MIRIDGSAGEGGGQVLRTALGLSLVTGKPLQIRNIRGKRKKPGLKRQHLTAVLAAQKISNAEVQGAELGSCHLEFFPNIVRPGKYTFSIGTAGSCTLVFQTILPALFMAPGASEIILEGGTHNPMAPPFDFLDQTFLPLLKKMGVKIISKLDRPGFFPVGGGRMRITIEPVESLHPIELTSVSNISLSARAVCAELPEHIASRELNVVRDKLDITESRVEQVYYDQYGPGNILTVFAHSDQLTETFTGFGQKNISAEKVASRTVEEIRNYLRTKAPVGRYLADQLLIPLALSGKGRFRTGKPSGHTLTNIEVIKLFLERDIRLEQVDQLVWEISVAAGI